MHEINSGVHNCDLHIGQTSIQHDPNRNFWFKLSSEKRAKLYKFLFQDTRPSYRTDDDYRLRRQVAIGTLDGYHGGSREAAANFVDKLEECYFDQGKTEVTLNIFRAHFNDEEDFNPNDDEEVSVGNTEFDLEATYRKHAAGVAFSSKPASSQIPVGSPLGTPVVTPVATPTSDSSKGFLSSRRRPLSPTVRPGFPIPLPVLSGLLPGKIYHFGKDHRSTSEAEWGHHIVWHPDYFQPAVLDGEWVMSKVNDDGVWEVDARMSKEDFLQVANEEVVRRIAEINSLEPENSVVVWHGQSIFEILRDPNSLELLADFYGPETSPSYGVQIEWVISSGGGGTGGGGGGGIDGGGGGGTGSGGGGGTGSGGGGGTVSGGGGNQGMRGAGGDDRTGSGGRGGTRSGGRGGTRSGGQSGYQPSSARTIPPGMGARLTVEGAASQTSAGSRLVEPTAALLFNGGCIHPTIRTGVFACSKQLGVGSVPCTVSAGSNFASDLEGEVGSIKSVESELMPHVDAGCLSISCEASIPGAKSLSASGGSILPTASQAGETHAGSHDVSASGGSILRKPSQTGQTTSRAADAGETQAGSLPVSAPDVQSLRDSGGFVLRTTSQDRGASGLLTPVQKSSAWNLSPPRGEITKDQQSKSSGSDSTYFSEDKDVIDETVEMQATSPRDVRCGGTDDDFLLQLYSGIDTRPLSVDNFVCGDSTQALDMRPSQLPVVILVSGPCVEEKDVTMSEQEEGVTVVYHPLGDDIARNLFHDDEDLAATASVVDSNPGKTAGVGKALAELSLDEDVGQQRADSLSPSVEEVVRIVNADLDDLSKFPARLELVVASGNIKGARVVLGLKVSCVQEEVPRVQDEYEDDNGGHARKEAVTGKQ
ncbi:hypothetical protein CBR_g54019 [Chara braunii]|uniref:Uncharacterized protein n=1 Tax=Chara braunii TaxID=69332 RepID=A0A388MBI2_CHABU|nr:hypothetical protein CBR_g54019 [Chara braunii]|eukprot:GBG91924.1 hypothetical protein CBR_g54019 [Chara braunii]